MVESMQITKPAKKGRICVEDKCSIRAVYNIMGERKGVYCSTHKKPDMINVIHKKCIEYGCLTRAQFNFKDKKDGLYCYQHKKADMLDITSKKCIEDGCLTHACFNFEG